MFSTRRLTAIILVLIAGCLALMPVSCIRKIKAIPPVAKIEPKVDTMFGDIRTDNYYWLRQRGDSAVLAYLTAENEYTEAITRDTKGLQESLYKDMLSRIKETDLTVPYQKDDYFYYSRTVEGKQYKIYCRKKGSLDAEEEILLDLNALAEGLDYLDLGAYKVSPDHRTLAYSLDDDGSEEYALYFKNLATGEISKEKIENTYYQVEWANDNKTVFYATLDHIKRPDKLYRHRVGADPSGDALIFEEKDEAFNVEPRKTKDGKFLLVHIGSNVASEVYYLDADRPDGEFRLLKARQKETEYTVYHHGGYFYISTNDGAVNFKVMRVSDRNPARNAWKTAIPYADSVKIDGLEMFKDYMVVYERINGLKQIHVRGFKDETEYYIEFPEPVYTTYRDDNPEFDSEVLRFSYTSLVTPESVYDYNLKDKTRELRKQEEVLGGYDPQQYQSERIFAEASDGVMVPISIVYKKGMKKNGANPTWLYGYGSYGISSNPYFSSNRLPLLDHGFIYAIAHIRGGGDMGRQWYEDGKYIKKKNTFTDFIACAEHLITQEYTNSEKLIISGGSAGGLLIGAVVNMRPDLFRTAIAGVPFVDVVNTMLDPTIPLTVTEYEEWGNPNIEEYYFYMKSYSPYDNVEAKTYPNLLITAGLNDPRVQYWEPAKWAAKLRAMKTDDNLLILKTNMGAGHGGHSGRYDYLKDVAFYYAFALKTLGMDG